MLGTTNSQNGTATRRKPAHEIRLGNVRASIWANQTQAGTMYNTSFSRLYKDAEDQWKSSESFGRDELPILSRVIDLAHDWIFYGHHQDQE